jgi:hypothetical protein
VKLSTRIAAAALAAALPLAAVAGCGAEKKRTIKAELASARDNLQSSKAVSMTLRFNDSNGALKKIILEDDPDAGPIAAAVLKGGISYTVDAAGDKTLQQVQTQGTTEADIKKSLKDLNVALVIRDDKAAIAELRLVAGTLYAHVDLKEIDRLAVAGGDDPVTGGLDGFAAGNPQLKQGVADIRAGKWIQLPLLDYIDQFKDLAKSFEGEIGGTPQPSVSAEPDVAAVGQRVFDAVQPYVKVTDANDDSSDRVLDVNVQVRPALKAALAALKASGEPFASALKGVKPSEVDENVKDGTAHGTITLSNGHLKQVAVDLESVRLLDPEDDGTSLKGTSVVMDVDDTADEVSAPTNVSSFDLGELFESFFSAGFAPEDL